MFGLGKADRELDRDIVPTPVKMLFVVLVLAFVGLGFSGHLPNKKLEAVKNEVAFGCYVATGQSQILIDSNGLSISAQGIEPAAFTLTRTKSGTLLKLKVPLELGVQDGRLLFSAKRTDRGTLNFILWTSEGNFMPELNDLPITKLEVAGWDGTSPIVSVYSRSDRENCASPS